MQQTACFTPDSSNDCVQLFT